MGSQGRRYELDHLATFTVNGKHGLLHPEDGLRKLKTMDTSTGIWTMPCTMIINPTCVFIIDKQSGETMEQFPVHLIVDPMAVSTRPTDTYSNILLFTVLEDPKKIAAPTEMHIFQCVSQPADTIAGELKKLRSANRSPTYGGQQNGHSERYVREQVTSLNAMSTQPTNGRENPRLVAQSRQNGPYREGDEMTSEKIDRDVNILNHCFDDIEKFVGRLQLVAGARKELDRRKKGRSKKSKKNHGGSARWKSEEEKWVLKWEGKDGLLLMRARPPPKEEFIDVFKKFKLAFNLLARLRPYIHDPNAAELVHFLMTPLSLVVGAGKDPVNEMPDIVMRIVSPLLTYEGKELLTHCLSSKEHEFWVSLGEAWTLSREQWNSFVPPYYPKFSDGWEPYTPSVDGVDGSTKAGIEGAVASRVMHVKRQEAKHEAEDHVMSYPRSDGREYNETVYRNNQQRQESNPYDLDSPRTTTARSNGPDPKVAGYQAYVEKHIDRNRQVQEEARRRSQDGPTDTQHRQFLVELKNSGAKIYQVTHERTGRNVKELTVSKGEYLEILDDSRNWWKTRNQLNDVGYVPFTILKLVPQDVTMNGKAGGAVPPAPVPPPVLPVSEMTNVSPRNNYREREKSPAREPSPPKPRPVSNPKENLHDELKRRMSMGRKVDGSNVLRPVSKYINQESDADAVKDWLMSKNFSQRVLQATSNYTGADLFSLSKQETYQIAQNREEGIHLESQLLIQKNICGFDTLGQSELNAILHDRKRRADLANLGQPPPFIPRPPSSDVSDSDADIPTYGRFQHR